MNKNNYVRSFKVLLSIVDISIFWTELLFVLFNLKGIYYLKSFCTKKWDDNKC